MKLKSILLSGALALFSTTFVTAQSNSNISIGFRTGMTIPSLSGGSGNPLSEGYSTTTRFGVGVFAEFKISNLFSIQPMLEYTEEGAKKNGLQALTVPPQVAPFFQALNLPVPDYLYANFNSTAKMNYLMLPVLAKFGWDLGQTNSWRIYVDAGPYVGLLVSAKQVTSGSSDLYLDPQKQQDLFQLSGGQVGTQPFDATTDIKDQLQTFNFGLEGNIGLQYQIKKSKLFIEGGGNYGLMNIQKNTPDGQYDNGKNHIGAATIMVGYAYRL
jgi:hypothetical protein